MTWLAAVETVSTTRAMLPSKLRVSSSRRCARCCLRLGLRLLLGGEAVGLDHVVLEDLHGLGHRADLVLAADADDLGRHVALRQAAHGIGHRRDRARDAGHDHQPGDGAQQRRDIRAPMISSRADLEDLVTAVGRLLALADVEREIGGKALVGGCRTHLAISSLKSALAFSSSFLPRQRLTS